MSLKEKLNFEVKEIQIAGLLLPRLITEDEQSEKYIQELRAIYNDRRNTIYIPLKSYTECESFSKDFLSLFNADDIYVDTFKRVYASATIFDDPDKYILKHCKDVNGVFVDDKLITVSNLNKTKWVILYKYPGRLVYDYEKLIGDYVEYYKGELKKKIENIQKNIIEVNKYIHAPYNIYLKEALEKIYMIDLDDLN